MKKNEIPQDPSPLDNVSREICYAIDETGKYVKGLSQGWEVKAAALDIAWKDIAERVDDAKKKVLAGEVSPVLFFMELRLMDKSTLSAYTGFAKWRVSRHLKPEVFNRLSEKKMQI